MYALAQPSRSRTLGLVVPVLCLCAGAIGAQRPPVTQASQVGPAWALKESRSEMTDDPSVILTATATGEVQGWLHRVRPSLVVRCQERKLEVYLVTGMSSHVESRHPNHTVRYRIDTTSAVTETTWTESTDDEALFAPEPKELAERLMSASTVLIEWTPFRADPVRARFRVTGLEAHRARLVAACPGALSPLSAAERAAFAASPEGRAVEAVAAFKALVDSNPKSVDRLAPTAGAVIDALLGAPTRRSGGDLTTVRIAAVDRCNLTLATMRQLTNLTAHDTAWVDLRTLAPSPTVRSRKPSTGWAVVLTTATGDKTILTHQWMSRDRRPKIASYASLVLGFDKEEVAREAANLAGAAIAACQELSQ